MDVLLQLSVLQALLISFTMADSCTIADWWSSFDKRGFSKCSSTKYINGLWRNVQGHPRDGIYRIETANCCNRIQPYYNQPSNCVIEDWVASLDKNNQWSKCPAGTFIRGLYRSDGNQLHNIEYAKCCKPVAHPSYHGACYEQSVYKSFDTKGMSRCKDGYLLTGLYRGGCDELYCIEKFYCCKMVDSPPLLTSLYDAKTRVMDATQYNLALLAFYLGYGWPSGCQAEYVGEDFRLVGDSWVADKSPGPCNGYRSGHRLQMNYANWGFGIKSIKYGKGVIQEMTPYSYLQGTITNNDPQPATQEVIHTVTTTRQVTHTKTSSWKQSHELGIEINYTPPPTGGVGGSVSYKFGYENGESTSDAESKTQTKTLSLKTSKTLQGHTAAKYSVMVTNTRTTVPYTATIVTKFSAELDGFLRWGGGYNGETTNYHHKHRGSGDRPTFKYKFGDENKPFYTDLDQQSTRSTDPWMWHDMKQRWKYAQTVINYLKDERVYEFTLKGQFEDVIGQHADITWEDATTLVDATESSVDMFNESILKEHAAAAESESPERVFPEPPKVKIPKAKVKNIRQEDDGNV